MQNNTAPISLSILQGYSYEVDGIETEQKARKLFEDKFKNLEEFWKLFIVPMTRRILKEPSADHREDVDDKIKKIGVTTFSILYHVYYSKIYLDSFLNPPPSSLYFQYFYIHASTACDLIKGLVYRVISLVNFLNDEKIKDTFTRKDICKFGNWFNEYVRNNKCKRLEKDPELKVFSLFFDSEIYKDLSDFHDLINEYRNVIVHSVFVTFVYDNGRYIFPIKKALKNYIIKLHAQYEIDRLTEVVKARDFEVIEKIMTDDFNDLHSKIENILEKLTNSLKKAMFFDKDQEILDLYNIRITNDD